MSILCAICADTDFLSLPSFPTWLGGYHVPIAPDSNLVPFLPQREESDNGKRRRVAAGSLGVPSHKTLEGLLQAAENCEICSLIRLSVEEVKRLWEGAHSDERFAYYDKAGPPKYEFYLSKRRDGEDGILVWSPASKNDESFLMAAIGFCVDDHSPLKDHFRGRPIARNPTDLIHCNRLRNWLLTCDESHTCCADQEPERELKPLPLRVLDIGEIGDLSKPLSTIRLVEPGRDGIRAKYAALSHCWGTAGHFKTTKGTIQKHKEGIEVSRLPKTYRDAITVARMLSLRYLWIDSLCIIQDSDNHGDWKRESGKMASIYRDAYITIAASNATSDTDGFLEPRKIPEYVTLPITFPPKDEKGELQGDIKLFSIANHLAANGSHYVFMDKEPLCQRAWALQERYLAPRTLHFCKGQTCFECAEAFVTEDGFYGDMHWFNITERHKGPVGWRPREFRGGKNDKPGRLAKWYELLFQYSTRKISNETDKLPALSGLARVFKDWLEDDYVAGLWRGDIVEGLCYQCFGGEHSRPKTLTAPTWSWASVQGTLAATEVGGWTDLVDVKDVKVEVEWLKSNGDVVVVDVKDVKSEEEGLNPYGDVRPGAKLVLYGILERLTVSEEPEPDADKVPHQRYPRACFEGGDSFGSSMSFDLDPWPDKEAAKKMELYGIPLAADIEGSNGSMDGAAYVLMVTPDGKGSFQREGFMLLSDKDLLKKWHSTKNKSTEDNITGDKTNFREITLV